jgi:general transcription factor 3C polypeptide 4
LHTASGQGPLQILRSTFFRLRVKSTLNRVHARVLEVLRTPSEDHSFAIVLPNWSQEMLIPELRAEFRASLASHLFGWDILLSLRMRLSLADFVWVRRYPLFAFFLLMCFVYFLPQKLSGNPERQSECGRVAQSLLTTISHRNLRTIIRHLAAVANKFTGEDVIHLF